MVCDYCKSIHFPEKNDEGVRVLDQPSGQACPVCAVPLVYATWESVKLRYCTKCCGMLLGMSDFLGLVDALRLKREAAGTLYPPAPDEEDLNRRIDCPDCHRQMDTHRYAGPGNIIIDNCPWCALNWLDHNEVLRVALSRDRVYDADGQEIG